MKLFYVVLLMVCSLFTTAEEIKFDFNDAGQAKKWHNEQSTLESGYNGTPSLKMKAAAPHSTNRIVKVIDHTKIKGQSIILSAMVKADNVSAPLHRWNGIKVMLKLYIGQGIKYPQVAIKYGKYDWKAFSQLIRIPDDVTKVELVLGLEETSGTVWFDDVTIKTLDNKASSDIQMDNFRGHDLPRLRGVMYGPRVKEQDFKDLVAWGANHIRFQVVWVPMSKSRNLAKDIKKYQAWIKSFLPNIDHAVKLCRKYNIKMLLDLHTVPGGRGKHNINGMFSDQKYIDEFIKTWQLLAKRYKKDGDVIYAYDIFNEPLESTNGKYSWIDIACSTIKAIREIDPDKAIVFEPGPFGGCEGFDLMKPLPFKRIIYSFHMYNPHKFTHQLKPPATISYPGIVNGIKWDKKRLRESMLPAIDFCRKYNVHMYIGEFSAIRWAPDNSAYRYLQDTIELFEELKWDWAYHAFREYHGWSVEHDMNPAHKKPSKIKNPRYKLLGKWLKKNSSQSPKTGKQAVIKKTVVKSALAQKPVLGPEIIKLLDYKQDNIILDGGAKIVNDVIILKGTPKQFVKAMFKLPTSMVGNKVFYVIGDVKMKNVQGGKKHWHSAKFQVNYVLNGKKVYKSKSLIGGDIDQWIPLNFKVQIPAGKKIDSFNLLVAMERNSGLFQIKNLRLTRKPYKQPPVFTFPLPEKLAATITINTKQSKKFNNLLLGLNSQFMGWGPAEYNYANAKIMDLIKTIKVPLLRFPGGTVSNYYDWKTDLPILPKDIKLGKGFINKWQQHIANKRQFGFADYAKMVKQFNIESLLVFNIRQDSVKSHLDRLQHRIESGIGITAIELGNENYLKPNYGGFTKNADEYIARCNKVYLELNKQEPKTIFGVNINHETGGTKWNNTVMKDNKTGNVFLHPYVAISREWNEQIDWTIMRSVLFGYTRLGKMLKHYTDAYPTTPVYLSEWGLLCAPTISKSHIAALATFDAFFNIINYEEQGVIKAATLHCFFGGYMGLFFHDNKGAIIRTGGTSIIYNLAIETFLNADLLASQTKSFMLSKALPAVNSRATINAKGTLKIFAINKTPLPCTYTINLDGKKYLGQAQIKSYTRKNIIKAENFKLNEKLTTEKTVTGNIVLPPYSANVISINSRSIKL